MGVKIVYGSHYGTTERYAQELSRRVGIPAVDYRKMGEISSQDTVIYLGGLYAGGLVGLKKSLPKLKTAANLIVVTVGLADPEEEENVQHIRASVTKQLGEELTAKTLRIIKSLADQIRVLKKLSDIVLCNADRMEFQLDIGRDFFQIRRQRLRLRKTQLICLVLLPVKI